MKDFDPNPYGVNSKIIPQENDLSRAGIIVWNKRAMANHRFTQLAASTYEQLCAFPQLNYDHSLLRGQHLVLLTNCI